VTAGPVTDPREPGYVCTVCGKRRDEHAPDYALGIDHKLCVRHEDTALSHLLESQRAEDRGDARAALTAAFRANAHASLANAHAGQEVARAVRSTGQMVWRERAAQPRQERAS
jgi:hypothetical protein